MTGGAHCAKQLQPTELKCKTPAVARVEHECIHLQEGSCSRQPQAAAWQDASVAHTRRARLDVDLVRQSGHAQEKR
jgi:hypothetical protein